MYFFNLNKGSQAKIYLYIDLISIYSIIILSQYFIQVTYFQAIMRMICSLVLLNFVIDRSTSKIQQIWYFTITLVSNFIISIVLTKMGFRQFYFSFLIMLESCYIFSFIHLLNFMLSINFPIPQFLLDNSRVYDSQQRVNKEVLLRYMYLSIFIVSPLILLVYLV